MMDDLKPRNSLEDALLRKLAGRHRKSTLRKLTTAPPGAVDLSSNDFLSLSTSPRLRAAFLAELARGGREFPLGSGGSRLLDGNSEYANGLERELAAFHGAPAALLFNSGFDANAGVFACVPQAGDAIVHDELIHASVHDGMKLSRATTRLSFRHNCTAHLHTQLERLLADNPNLAAGRASVFVAVESVYSMDGDLAPLAGIAGVLDALFPAGNAHLIVDEAHATGVVGPQGRGLVSQLGLERRVLARLHTFGKSLACSGAVVLCSPVVRAYLINYARPLIYTTFMPFPSLAAVKAAYSLLQDGTTEALVAHLQLLVSRLHIQLLQMFARYSHVPGVCELLVVPATCPQSPIFSLLSEHARSLAKHCQDSGFVVRAVVPPTVPTRRVRVCLHAGNSLDDVSRLVQCIDQWLAERTNAPRAATEPLAEQLKARL